MNKISIVFFVPILFVYFVFGIWFYFFPPKNVNRFIGYRTELSMKNQKSWDYSQKRFGEILLKLITILILILILLYFFNMLNTLTFLIFLFLSLFLFLIPIVIVQKELKNI